MSYLRCYCTVAVAELLPGTMSKTLDVTVASYRGEGSVVTIRYGDRRLVQELTPAEP